MFSPPLRKVMRAFSIFIKCSYFNVRDIVTLKLAATVHIQNHNVQHLDHYEIEIEWLLEKSPEFFIAGNPNEVSASKK